MTQGGVAKKVRLAKEQHPEKYCGVATCLWRTDDKYCPRHRPLMTVRETLKNRIDVTKKDVDVIDRVLDLLDHEDIGPSSEVTQK